MCFQCLLSHAHQTGGRGVYLEAALSAAGALRAVYGNDSVTNFSAAEVGAAVDLAVNDDAGADTGAQCDADRILCTLGCACHILAVCCGVGIVLNESGLAQFGFQILHHGGVVEAQIVGVFDDAGSTVGNAGGAHADPLDLIHGQTSLFGCLTGHLCHICGDLLLRTGQVGLHACLCQDLIALVYHAGNNVCTA